MAERNVVFLDWDGTVANPGLGIHKTVRAVMQKLGFPIRPLQDYDFCVGPPVRSNFRVLIPEASEEFIERAATLHAELYPEIGWPEYSLYEGVTEMLEKLRAADWRLMVVSGKRVASLRHGIRRFSLEAYFDAVYGSDSEPGKVLGHKVELIRHVVWKEQLEPAHVAMVGDHPHDMEGARAAGALAVGATWGFGTPDALRRAGAVYLAHAPGEVFPTLSRKALRLPLSA